MNFLTRVACWVILLSFLTGAETSRAHDPTHQHASWYNSQTMNPATQKRLGVQFKSCCDHGDNYETRFKLVSDGTKYGAESYEYWHKEEGRWKEIHPDLIQRKKTPDGKPKLFLSQYSGRELCFIIDEEGI